MNNISRRLCNPQIEHNILFQPLGKETETQLLNRSKDESFFIKLTHLFVHGVCMEVRGQLEETVCSFWHVRSNLDCQVLEESFFFFFLAAH